MARASKPVDLIKESSRLTKEEYEQRKEQEEKIKGNDNLVYKIPRNLSKDGKKLYKFIVGELKASGILNNLDITMLETCVDAIIKMQECKELIEQYGLVTTKENGDLVRNPASVIYKDYNTIFNKCCMELGLSPSARSKLASINVQAKTDNEDQLLKILGGGK